MTILQTHALKKYYGSGDTLVKALDGVDLSVEEGEFVAIVGTSGSGKSTLLHMLGGLDRPTSGTVTVDGKEIFSLKEEALTIFRRRKIGFVFQAYNLVPVLSVYDNIVLPIQLDGARVDRAHVDRIIQALGLESKLHSLPGQLSGGQQQRCALARILASEPTAILLDEPFSALDSYLKYQLELELAETLGGFPGTVLWVSHDRGEVFRNCRRVCVIDRGRSQPVTTLGELFRSPGTEAAARLSGCKNYADARPREDAVFLPDWGLTLSCGRPVPEGVCRIGIRAHHVQLAGPGAENAFSCTAVKVVEDVFSTIVLLRPEGAAPEAPLLRMELDKDNWQAVPDKDRLTVSVPPEAILLLES